MKKKSLKYFFTRIYEYKYHSHTWPDVKSIFFCSFAMIIWTFIEYVKNNLPIKITAKKWFSNIIKMVFRRKWARFQNQTVLRYKKKVKFLQSRSLSSSRIESRRTRKSTWLGALPPSTAEPSRPTRPADELARPPIRRVSCYKITQLSQSASIYRKLKKK